MKGFKGSKVEATKYNWCLTRDIGSLTLVPRVRSLIRKGGLVYTQFYNMNKLQHDALRRFPWQDGDDTMVWMAVDKHLREALRTTMGGTAVNVETCRKSFNTSGRRYVIGVRETHHQSYGAREEHRMSLKLLQEVTAELRSRGNPVLREPKTRIQFYVHPTSVINNFSEAVTLPFASWYQNTLGWSGEGTLGTDRQKLAVLQSLLLKSAYSSTLLAKHPMLWQKRVRTELEGQESVNEIGLGLKNIIKEYGFGWLPGDIFNWKANSFAPGIADQFPFPIRSVQTQYNKRKRECGKMVSIFQEIDQVLARVTQRNIKRLSSWLGTRIMRQYHEDVAVSLYAGPYEFKGKDNERQRQREEELSAEEDSEPPSKKPRVTRVNRHKVVKIWQEPPALTYPSVRDDLLQEEPLAAGQGKDIFRKEEYLKLIFGDGERGQGWKKHPYRHALNFLRESHPFVYAHVMVRLEKLFHDRVHCLPMHQPSNWWAPYHGSSKSKPAWIAFDKAGHRINCSVFGYDNAEVGSDSSWRNRRSMHQARFWNVSVDELLAMDEDE